MADWTNNRGQVLHTVEALPLLNLRAVLVFHHGYGEHTGRYARGMLQDLGQLATVPSYASYQTRHYSHIVPFSIALTMFWGLPVFKRLAEHGVAVHSFDCHGHGLSEPRGHNDRVLFWRFSDVVSKLSFLRQNLGL